MPTTTSTLRGLVIACHPGPAAVVTLVIAALSWSCGRSDGGVALMALATAVGQLSIGWSNDAIDAPLDLAGQRTRKPVVAGRLTTSTLWRAATIAAIATVPLSFVAAGWIGGAFHLVSVASAWSYNVGLKATVFSGVPYLVAFGCVPAFVTFGLTPSVAPALWAVIGMALLGLAAHLANAMRDQALDAEVGAGGVVQALGPRNALIATVGSVVLASATIAVGVRSDSTWAAIVCVVAAVALIVVTCVQRTRPRAFEALMIVVLIDLAALLLSGGSIT